MTLAEQLKAAQDSLAAIKIEQTNLTNSHATLTQERDTLKASNATLTTERDTARTERDTVTTERDTLKTTNSTLTTQRDELQVKVTAIPETVSRKLADHCSHLGIALPLSGIVQTPPNVPGGTPPNPASELKGRDRLQQGIRAQLVKQGFTKSLSKPLETANV